MNIVIQKAAWGDCQRLRLAELGGLRARELPSVEWYRLKGLDLARLLEHISPADVTVLVCEDADGNIVGCTSSIHTEWIEGTWIAPTHRRKAGVFRSLHRAVMAVSQIAGRGFALGAARPDDAVMTGVIRGLGGEIIPAQFYAIPVREK